jgi:hypothetical protein
MLNTGSVRVAQYDDGLSQKQLSQGFSQLTLNYLDAGEYSQVFPPSSLR